MNWFGILLLPSAVAVTLIVGTIIDKVRKR